MVGINIELTDKAEIHFIEIPKLPKNTDVKDLLVGWIEFLKDPNSEVVQSLEETVEAFREAKRELIKMSNDDKQRAIYEMREKGRKDLASALGTARREGIEEGLAEGIAKGIAKGLAEGEEKKAREIVLNSAKLGLDAETISKIANLSVKEVEKILKKS